MAGFDDLLAAAQPYLDWEEMAVTAGTSWTWSYLLTDDAGALVDLRSGFTGSLSVRTRSSLTDIAPVAVTFPAAGGITCSALDPDETDVEQGRYFHELTVTRNSDGATLIVVGAEDSIFVIKRKVTL